MNPQRYENRMHAGTVILPIIAIILIGVVAGLLAVTDTSANHNTLTSPVAMRYVRDQRGNCYATLLSYVHGGDVVSFALVPEANCLADEKR